MLFGMQRYRSLADLRLVIAGELLMFLFGHVPPELAVELRAHPSDIAGLLDPASDVDTERGVVDRQCPTDRLDAGELRDPRIGQPAQGRKIGLGYAVEDLAGVVVASQTRGVAARRHRAFDPQPGRR